MNATNTSDVVFGLQVFALVLNIADVLIHSVAIYALISLYTACRQKIQRLYLLHLSSSIAILNLLEFLRRISSLLLFLTTKQSRDHYSKVEPYLKILTFTGMAKLSE